MKDEKILNSIKKSLDQAPLDLLDDIKKEKVEKMSQHDHITNQEPRKNSFNRFIAYASLAASFIFVVFGWNYQTRIPDNYIYLDINPGLEIVTNRQNKVIDLEASNEDSKALLEYIDYKGKGVEDLTKFILDLMIDKDYLDKNNNYLLLSVYNKDELKADSKNAQLNDLIHDYLENNNIDPIVLSQKLDKTSSLEKYAEKYNISINKMTFIRNLILLNPKLEIENLVELNLKQLISLSQNMDLEIEKIIDSSDLDKIKKDVDEQPEELEIKENIDKKHTDNQRSDIALKEKIQEVDRDDEEKEDSSDLNRPIISEEEAKTIALSIANGKIVDFDFDDDDLEYEIEIEANNLEYEIKIDAVSGAVLKVDIDD